ncbi:MAG: type III-B CRISPR module RAMP protein Cmr6 [Bacteroidota bacterium]
MPNPNVGWLYYVDYFRQDNSLKSMNLNFLLSNNYEEKKEAGKYLAKKCKRISDLKLNEYSSAIDALNLPNLTDEDCFTLTTTYPGLLVGAGYEHELHLESEFKLGFFFDYTSGLPVIPGSSVKGVLRSAFKTKELIKELLSDKNEREVEELELEIFEGVDIPETNKTSVDAYKQKKNWKYLPSPKKDVFYDAVIFGSNNKGQEFLAADFITPHKDQFANPIPLQFMKVFPEVKFLFQFDVKNSKIAGMTREGKRKLFEKIIQNLGIGAKTRTGYGWMQ